MMDEIDSVFVEKKLISWVIDDKKRILRQEECSFLKSIIYNKHNHEVKEL